MFTLAFSPTTNLSIVVRRWMTTLSSRSLILVLIRKYTWKHSSMMKKALEHISNASMRFSRSQACWTQCNLHLQRKIGYKSYNIFQSKLRQAWRNRRRSSAACKQRLKWSRGDFTRISCVWLRKIGQWSVHSRIALDVDEEQQQVKTSPSLTPKSALKAHWTTWESQRFKPRASKSTTLWNATKASNSRASIPSLQAENYSETCSILLSRHSMLAKEESRVALMDFMLTTLSRRAILTHNQEKVKGMEAQLSATLWLGALTKSHRSLESSFRSTSTSYWELSHTSWINHLCKYIIGHPSKTGSNIKSATKLP